MAHISDYDDQRHKVAAQALKVFHQYGPERSLQMFYGAIDALTYAVFAIKGPGKHEIGIEIDNTKPVELPCDCGPNAA